MSNNPVVEFKRNLGALIDSKELPLPSNVSTESFRNAAVVAVQDNPKILSCDQASVFKSIRTLAAAGLVPDGREAALVPFKTKDGNSWIDKCQAMPMVFGLIKMVRRSGEVSDIRAHIVYQNEVDQGKFTYVVGDEEKLEHEPILFGDRGAPVAAYAIAKLKDGGIVREFMSAEEIDTVRRSSAAQKIYQKGAKPKVSDDPIGIWKDWWAEMWKKTVIRRLCKRLDMSSEDMRRVMIEQDNQPMRDVTPDEPQQSAFQQKVQQARAAQQQEEHEEENAPPIEQEQEGATIDGEASEVNEPHWTTRIDTDDAFPGDEVFTEGAIAFKEGKSREECPYEGDVEAACGWLVGWDEAKKASE
ncbi:MAG: hypothetical protein EP341_03780 [Sphingomonadales bacterium]|nr:MAG: hypothetical protein EP341_03780 [Sphingomonadales bacterium]